MSEYDDLAAGIAARQRNERNAISASPVPDQPIEQPQLNEYNDLAAGIASRQRQARQLQTSLEHGVGENPEQAAEVNRLARDRGVSTEIIRSDLPGVKRDQAVQDINPARLTDDSPITARFLANPDNAAMAHDNIANFSDLEQALQYGKNVGSAVLSGVYGMSEGVLGMAQAGGALVDRLTNPLSQAIGVDLGIEPAIAQVRAGQTYLKNYWAPKGSNDIESGIYSGISSLTQNMMMLPMAMQGSVARGLGAMAGITGGQTFAEDRDKGVGLEHSLLHATSNAMVEAATENLPMGKLVGDLANKAGFWKMLGHQAVSEIPGEQVATIFQDMNDWAVQHPEKSFQQYLEDRPSAAAQTLVATLVGVGGNVSVLKGVEKIADLNNRKAVAAVQAAEYTAKVDGLVKADKVLQRDPTSFENFIKEATEDGPVDHLYLGAEVLNQSGLAPKLAEVAPELAEKIQVALATGGQVQIPVDLYATKVAPTEVSTALLSDLKTDPDGFSMREAQEYMAAHNDELKAMVERSVQDANGNDAFKASQEVVRQQVLADLNAANRFTPAVNELYASLHSAYAAVRAAQIGITPEQFFRQHMLRVQAEQVGGSGPVLDQGDMPVTDQIDELTGLPLNEDGTVTVYHHTSAENAERIRQNGWLQSAGEPDLYFTTQQDTDTGYGDTAIPVRVKPERLQLDDEFPSGRQDYRVDSPERGRRLKFLPDGSAVLNQSATLRAGTETLKKYGLDPNRKYKTREIAAALEARQRAKYGTITAEDRSDEALKKISKWMVEEVLFEMQHPEKSGVGWYSEKYQAALNKMSDAFPELKTDSMARNTMTALIAITSDGQKVVPNFTQAMDIYGNYRETGQFTTSRGHARQESIDTNLKRLQELADMMSPEELHTYLMREETISELKQIAKDNGGEMKSDYQAHIKMPMAAVEFGPKLGAFYANLMGAHGYLTMDRWWSRTFNRYRGTLLTAPTQQGLERFRELIGKPDLSDDETIAATVEPRNAYAKKGFKDGSELEKAANTIYKAAFDELEDAPFNATDRTFMLDAVNKAQKSLKRRGYNLSVADIQAILWYYEKRLYGDLGARKTADVSYEEAAKRVVSKWADSRSVDVRGESGRAGQDSAGDQEQVPPGEEYFQSGEVSSAGDLLVQHNLSADNLLLIDASDAIVDQKIQEFHQKQLNQFTRNKSQFAPDTLAEWGEFKTGQPVAFDYIHNTESATKLFGKPKKGDRFQRDIEPSGRYVNQGDVSKLKDPRFIGGKLTFQNPLVLQTDNWKQALHDHYKKRGKHLSQAIINDGYDGVVTVGKYGPSEILDLTTFDYGKALYQSGQGDLLVQHNLSADNLLHAQKMGGIAVPSLAVTKKENPLTGFGEITLVGSKDLVDPKGYAKTKVFGADIYSPRYPQISYNLDKYALKRLNDILAPYQEGRQVYGSDIERVDDLVSNDAFKKYADEKLGDTAKWSQMKEMAANLLTEVGAGERIFQGFTYSGNRRYIAHTLDNVVKILKKELRGGEDFNYGVGSLRAKFTPEFKSIEQIRKAKDRLMGKDEFEKIKEEIDNDFFEIVKELTEFHHHGNSFGFADTVIQSLQDAAKMGIPRALQENGFSEVPAEIQQTIAEYLTRLRHLPTEYFEAKILREVDLAEFAAAVVPEGVKPEVIKALESRGVTDIRYYKKGDEADRTAKIGELEHLFFQQREANRGAFNPANNTITLLKNADLSTFLHESAHFFFENDIAIASDYQEQANIMGIDSLSAGERQILDDMHTLLSWHGIQGDLNDQLNQWHNMGFEERRSYHERTAESFERYMLEGKAPSLELAHAFQSFRAWMMQVYKSIKNFLQRNPEAGQLSDEVRQVFDRMLATQEEIQLAEMARSMIPLFSQPGQAGISPEQLAEFHRLGIDATNTAIDELQARALKDLGWFDKARSRELKKLQSQARGRRRELLTEARTEIMSQPVYIVWDFLTRKMTAEDRIGAAPSSGGGDRRNIVDPSRDSLFTAIGKLGGIDKADLVSDGWIDDSKGADKPHSGVIGKPVWRVDGTGRSVDDIAQSLAEDGYIRMDVHGKADLADFAEKFGDELRGSKVYSHTYDYSQLNEQIAGGHIVNPAALGAGKLDLDSLINMGYDDTQVALLTERRMVQKTGALHPDIVNSVVGGFSSGDEMVRALLEAVPPKQAIDQRVDQMMIERYGDLSDQASIELAADKAIHNDLRAKMIAAEMAALDTAARVTAPGQTRGPSILPRAAKEFAAGMIARLRVRDIRPAMYANAEMRAAKAAATAEAKGDVSTAAAEKRNQLIQHYATRAAYDTQDEVERGVRYLRSLDKDAARKRISADYMDQIDQLLEQYQLRPLSLKEIDRRKSLAAWLESQKEQGLEPDIDPRLVQQAQLKSYRDMTVEEFRGLMDAVKQIEHLGALKNKLLTAKDQREFEAVRDEMAASINEHAGDRVANTRTATSNMERKIQGLKNFWASHIKAATWARIMDGGEAGGPVWEYLVRPANERGDWETEMNAAATEHLSTILKPVFALGKMGGEGMYFKGVNRSFNRQARLAIALNVGNQGNLQRLLGGEGWTLEQIRPVLESLSPVEWNAVQQIWDHLESYRPLIAEKERRVYGKEPDWVEPTPFEVKASDGTIVPLRGGYYPIKYDPMSSQRAEEHADAEGARRELQGAYTSATTRRSFTKNRSEAVMGRPLLYTLTGLYSGVTDVIHDLAWHEWLIDANRLLRSDTLDKAIREHYGPEVKNQFKTWAKDIADGGRGAAHAIDAMASFFRQSVSASGLGFNVMSAVIQPLGFTQSIVQVGAKYVGRGISKYIANPKGLTRQVNDMSSFMANRARTRFRELNELRNQVQDQSAAREFMGRNAYYFMLRAQQIVDVPTWWGAYEKAVAAGNDDGRAIALADQAVIDSQGGGQIKDLSAIERGGATQKLFTVFYSFMNTALNVGVNKTMTSKSRGKLAADLAMLYVVPAVLGAVLKAAITPGDSGDDEPEELAKSLAKAELSYLTGLMVGVRELGGLGYDYAGPAGVRMVADTYKFLEQGSQLEFDDGFRKAAVNLIGDLSGLPAAQINRTWTGTEALLEGKTDNPAAVVMGFQRPH